MTVNLGCQLDYIWNHRLLDTLVQFAWPDHEEGRVILNLGSTVWWQLGKGACKGRLCFPPAHQHSTTTEVVLISEPTSFRFQGTMKFSNPPEILQNQHLPGPMRQQPASPNIHCRMDPINHTNPSPLRPHTFFSFYQLHSFREPWLITFKFANPYFSYFVISVVLFLFPTALIKYHDKRNTGSKGYF